MWGWGYLNSFFDADLNADKKEFKGSRLEGSVKEAEESWPETWDYCFVFDVGDKEEVIEYENEEDPEAPPRQVSQRKDFLQKTMQVIEIIKKAGLSVSYYKDGTRHVKTQYIFALVGARENVLRSWANKSDYDLELDPIVAIKYGRKRKFALAELTYLPDEYKSEKQPMSWTMWQNLYAEYTEGKEKLYVKHYRDEDNENNRWKKKDSLFRTKDRLRLVYEAMIQDAAIGGGQLPMTYLQKSSKHPLKTFYPLHQPSKLKWFRVHWLRHYHPKYWIWIPVDEIRAYFGEPIGFYFAFLQHYITWLIGPAFCGLLLFWLQVGLRNRGFASVGLFLMSLCIWTVAFTDFWKRKQAILTIQWGQINYEEKEVRRPQFQGEWEVSEVTGLPEKVQNREKYILRMMVSSCFVLLFMTMVMTTMFFLMRYRVIEQEANNGRVPVFTSVWIGLLTAIMISIFDNIYKSFRLWLNEKENHRTQREYENANIVKMFSFRFLNAFMSLFFIAFIQPAFYKDSYLIDGKQLSQHEMSEEVLISLRIQILCIFLTSVIQQNLMELFFYPLEQRWSQRELMKDPNWVEYWANRNSYEVQRDLKPYPDTLEDMSELVIQFGHVTLFALAFPLAPFIAIIANIIEARVDGWELVKSCQRPIPLGGEGLGMWTRILEIFSTIAVVTNVCLFTFRTDRVAEMFGVEGEDGVKTIEESKKMMFMISSVFILLGFSTFLRLLIPDIPESVENHKERQLSVENILIQNAALDQDVRMEEINDEHKGSLEKAFLSCGDNGSARLKVSKIQNFRQWKTMHDEIFFHRDELTRFNADRVQTMMKKGPKNKGKVSRGHVSLKDLEDEPEETSMTSQHVVSVGASPDPQSEFTEDFRSQSMHSVVLE